MTKRKKVLQMWKRGVGFAVCSAMVVAAFPAFSDSVPAKEAKNAAGVSREAGTELMKAGSLPATEDTKTAAQPFSTWTGGSYSFRIPCFISLEHGVHRGNLVAAADARYTTPGDGGGLDTIASVSADMGETWNYSFPIWFPDSEGYASKNATTVIDPVLVEGEDGTIYCSADVNPTGITTHYGRIPTGNGYIDAGGKKRLALTDTFANASGNPAADTAMEKYAYYVGDFKDGYAPVLKRSDNSQTDWRVDEWYNIEKKDGGVYKPLTQKQVNTDTDIQQNVFYAASELHVFNIGYIWMVESKDGGMSWENPRILNDQVKPESGETYILVSPGKGLTTKEGDESLITIPLYGDQGGEKASFMYSKDGETWTRTNNVTHDAAAGKSSESEMVELSDGTLRMFSRTGKNAVNKICYTDAVVDENGEYSMGAMVVTSVSCWSDCNVSAVRYSKKVNGKDLVLVACPSGPGGRRNGKIYSFLVNNDESKTMEPLCEFEIKDPGYGDDFAYCCMAELSDGTIGILWEASAGGYIGNDPYELLYQNYHIKEIVPDTDIDGVTGNPPAKSDGITVCLEKGADYTINAESVSVIGGSEDAVSVTSKDAYFLCDSKTSTEANQSAAIENARMTFTEGKAAGTWRIKNEFINHYLTNSNNYQIFYLNPVPEDMAVEKAVDGSEAVFRIKNKESGSYICYNGTNTTFNRMQEYDASWTDGTFDFMLLKEHEGVFGDDLIPGYERASEIESGENYLLVCEFDGAYIVFYPYAEDCASWAGAGAIWNASSRNRVKFFKEDLALTKQTVITGLTAGEAVKVKAGETVYNIQVKEPVSKGAVDNLFLSAKQEADAYRNAEKGDYSAATWNTLQNACQNILDAEGNLSIADMKSLMENLTIAKNNLKLIDRAQEESKARDSIQKAQSDYTAGETKYTKESYEAFKKAYDALNSAIAGGKTDLEELQKLKQNLEKAQQELKEKPQDNGPEPVRYEEGKSYTVGDYSYTILSLAKKTAAVDGLSSAALKKINVKNTVTIGNESYKIISVADSAFKGSKNVTDVTLGANIETIGSSAFSGCGKLAKVTVSSTKLKTIGKKAFYNCKKLKTITLKTKKLAKIEKNAFGKIHKKAAVKVPGNKFSAYKKRFKNVKFKK